MGRILVVGSVNADVIIEIERLPAKGETMAASDNSGYVVAGGKGANQAVAAARLVSNDVEVQFVCNFGADGHGTMLKTVLSQERLDISLCSTVDAPSGQAFILLQKGGDNSIIIAGGANVAWPSVLPPAFQSAILLADLVLLQCEVPTHVNMEVARIANGAGIKVMLDMGGQDRPVPEELIPLLFSISPNETELHRLTGMPTATTDQVVAAARSLQARGVRSVLVSRGSDGAVLLSQDGQLHIMGVFPVSKVVDTTGAGDTFRAAFAVALVEGRDLQECLKFAAAAGASCVQRMGAIPSLPTRQQVARVRNAAKL